MLTLFVVFSIVTIWGNITLSIENFTIESDKVDIENGYKIAHISDYHNTHNKFINKELLASLNEQKPDVVFITGDLVDKSKTDIDKALDFVEEIIELAPVYYVTGNHECNISIYSQSTFDDFIEDLKSMGVNVLRNEINNIELPNGDSFNICGINDPYFHCGSSLEVKDTTDALCSFLDINKNEFNILLAHHPEQLDVYSVHGFDLVYSGHAHGGQGRLFGIGMIAPDQGFFPEYTSGVYTKDETTLIVSRGIGNSIFPVRFFNRAHLIYTTIK